MALHHLLFRCPDCGHDPLEGEGDRATCSACGRQYVRHRAGGTIAVHGAGETIEVPIGDLTQRIDEHGGALSSGVDADGRIQYSARATAQQAGEDQPVRFRGQVLGFVEQLGEGEPGELTVTEEALSFLADGQPAGQERTWTLLGIRAVQSASSSIQISPSEGGVVLFKFESDSPVRWERLVKQAMQRAYERAGRGQIKEFQPRIVSG